MQLKGIAFTPVPNEENERAVRNLNLTIAQQKPDTVVLVCPEGHVFMDAVSVDYTTTVKAPDGKEFQSDMGILDDMSKIFSRVKVPNIFLNPQKAEEFGISLDLEDGAQRYLNLLSKVLPEFKLVVVTTGSIEKGDLLECGRSIRESIETAESRAFMVVLGKEDGMEFDEILKASLGTGEYLPLLEYNPKRSEESEYDSVLIGVGATELLKTTAQIEDNPAPCVVLSFDVEKVELNPTPPKDGKPKEEIEFTAPSIIEKWQETLKKRRAELREAESDVLKMVRAAVELWVNEGRRLDFDTYASAAMDDSELLTRLRNQRTGVFVTILKNGKPRGTMGTVSPVCDNIALEMINNAIEAAAYDPQFVPIAPQELEELSYEVIVMDPPRMVDDLDELDPKVYGLIIEQGLKRGVVLPGIEEITTVEEQIQLAKERAGINEITDSWEPMLLSKFSVDVF